MADTDTIKIHKMISGELVPLEMKRQRFEKTMDRIDADVEKGASKAQIIEKYAEYIVSTTAQASKEKIQPEGTPLKAADKQTIVQEAVDANPEMTLGQIVKHVSAQGHMTAANVRYIASKIMK